MMLSAPRNLHEHGHEHRLEVGESLSIQLVDINDSKETGTKASASLSAEQQHPQRVLWLQQFTISKVLFATRLTANEDEHIRGMASMCSGLQSLFGDETSLAAILAAVTTAVLRGPPRLPMSWLDPNSTKLRYHLILVPVDASHWRGCWIVASSK